MTASLPEVRESLAAAINAGTGLRAMPFGEVDAIHPPCALVVGAESENVEVTFGDGGWVYMFQVTVLLARTDARGATRRLDELASPVGDGSLRAAVSNSDLWSADIDYARVRKYSPITEASRNDDSTVYLSRTFDIEVVF